MVLVGFASAISQGTSYIFKIITDAVEVGDFTTAMWAGLSYPVAVFVIQMLYRGSGITMSFGQTKVGKYAYDTLTHYSLSHSKGYFANRFSGSLVSKIANAASGPENLADQLVWTYLSIIVTFVVTTGFIVFVDVLAAGLFLGLVMLMVAVNVPLIKRKRVLSLEESEAGSELSGKVADIFSSSDAVRQYDRKHDEYQNTQTATEKVRRLGMRGYLYTEKILFVNGLILFLFFGAIMYVMLLNWQQGSISSGDFVLVLSLLSQITGTLVFMSQSFQRSARIWGNMDEGLKEIVVPHEITDLEGAAELTTTGGAIAWQAVTFAYQEEAVFKRLSLSIKPGERVGLVGPSGAGKSTFVSLLLRQHDIQYGQIMIDGQNIAAVTQSSLRQNIAMVPQEPLLFHRTIRENIVYGKPDATDAEVIEAATRAEAHDFISVLPDGYDTLVGERGVKLSGGQKQRVAIARAILKEAPILVLDEATSALDSESEVAIQTALEELMEGKTVIAVAHRLSTLRKMDRILVFDDGRIIEDGAHDELAQAGGLYARLWQHQAGGFLQE